MQKAAPIAVVLSTTLAFSTPGSAEPANWRPRPVAAHPFRVSSSASSSTLRLPSEQKLYEGAVRAQVGTMQPTRSRGDKLALVGVVLVATALVLLVTAQKLKEQGWATAASTP